MNLNNVSNIVGVFYDEAFLIVLLLAAIPAVAFSVNHWFYAGYVKRTLIDSTAYGGCMMQLENTLPQACRTKSTNGGSTDNWVSLDCNGVYFNNGDKAYSTAIVAMTTNMRVTVALYDDKRSAGFCTVRRLDMFK